VEFWLHRKQKQTQQILSSRVLKGLEYRGYDSWGIAIKVDGKIESEKHVGKIGEAKTILPTSTIA